MAGVDYIVLSVSIIGLSLGSFAAPIGINRLLESVIVICGSVSYSSLSQLPGNRRCKCLYSAMVLDHLALCWANIQKCMQSMVFVCCIEDDSSHRGIADAASLRAQLANPFES
jgi:hypothetical protein